ncbi:hypothetical protein CR513_60673, partial [Mucuna pruriens]
MTRSNLGKLHAYNPTIDRIFHRLIRSPRNSELANNSHNSSAFGSDSTILKFDNVDFDSNLDPHKHLKEFHGAQNLISNMPGNTQQFSVRGSVASIVVNEIRLKNKINELTSLVRQLAIGQHHLSPLVRVCSICASIEHLIDACSTLQEIEPNNAKVVAMMGGQQYGFHPTQNVPQNHQRYQSPPPFRQQYPIQHDLVKQMATSNIQFQQNMTLTILDVQTHIGQLATTVINCSPKVLEKIPLKLFLVH